MSGLMLGIGVFFALGTLLVLTSLDPHRNLLTRMLYRIWTVMPRAGSMTDAKWVLSNGIALLLAGVLFLGLLLVRLIS